jgi:AcrR family transcriptional regulator
MRAFATAHGVAAGGDGRMGMSELQRSRLLGGAVAAVEELGWSSVTVASIAARAHVSRRSFYASFSDREDCLLEVLRDTVARIASEPILADLSRGLPWRERIRTGLWAILCFFDGEPELARLCVTESVRGDRRVSQWREEVLASLAAIVDEGRLESARAAQVPALTAEGSVGAVLTILHKRLLDNGHEPLSELLGELTAMIVLPYLGATAARAERTRSVPEIPSRSQSRAYRAGDDPLKDIPMRVTYRTARVLQAAALNPGASNRRIGEQADVHDQGQISKLLVRLQRLNLIANAGNGYAKKGEANAWQLTRLGERVTQQLALDAELEREGRAA